MSFRPTEHAGFIGALPARITCEGCMVETATQTLHRLTSYVPAREWDAPVDDPRIVQDLEVNDLERLPWFFKRYGRPLPTIELPRELPTTTGCTVEVLAGVATPELAELNLPHLARLLHLAAGVVRTMDRPYGTYPFRAAGSAGGRFPLEVYVGVPQPGELPEGVHWYDPAAHALLRVGPAPRGDVPVAIITGVPWRTGWRYRERGFRHLYWDAGTMLAQLLAAMDSAGLSGGLYTRFPDEQVAELVGADGVHEFPLALVALGDGAPAIEPSARALGGAIDADPVEFPLVTAAQHAGDMDELGERWDRGAAVEAALRGRHPVEKVVLARGSQRRMDPTRGLSEDLLRVAMDVSLRGVEVPHYFVAHDIDGLSPGVYRWPHLERPTHAGDLREELYRICLEQGLARDAAFVTIGATDIGELDDRSYRDAQLAAGLVEGRLHLAAYDLGVSASGMTFIDSEVPALLGAELDGLLFTCVGVPDYVNSPGGMPGAPTKVRPVAPRLSGPGS